jgi:hypothetical protein
MTRSTSRNWSLNCGRCDRPRPGYGSGDYKLTNASVPRVVAAHARLLHLGNEGENVLRGLLDHTERGVRLWAAWHALEFEPERAERVLADLALLKGSLVGFSAQMALRRRRNGGE